MLSSTCEEVMAVRLAAKRLKKAREDVQTNTWELATLVECLLLAVIICRSAIYVVE